MALQDSALTNVSKEIKTDVAKFGHAVLYELAEAPGQATYQFIDQASAKISGKHLPSLEITKPDDSGWSTAGSFVGTVAKYYVLSKLVHGAFSGEAGAAEQTLNMTVKRASLESTLVGATAGFLTPVVDTKDLDNNYFTEKGIRTVVSAGSFGIMGGTASTLGKSPFMSAEKGSLVRAVSINGIAGIAGGTAESTLDAALHHQSLDLKKTAINAGSYGLFGAAFGGATHLMSARGAVPETLGRSETSSSQPAAEERGPWTDNARAQRTTLKDHAARAIRTAQDHVVAVGNYLDASIARVNPFLMMEPQLQPAYARGNYYNTFGSGTGARARASFVPDAVFSTAHSGVETERMAPQYKGPSRGASLGSSSAGRAVEPVSETQPPANTNVRSEVLEFDRSKVKPASNDAEGPGKGKKAQVADSVAGKSEGMDETDETDAQKGSVKKRTYSIESVLARSPRGAEIQDVLQTLAQEHPSFLKGLRAENPQVIGGGRDTVMLKLADGKYKNALLRFTTISGQAQETLTPTEWDPEWGKRPYDAPILSKVIEVEHGPDERVFVYVQERGEGAISTDHAAYDVHDDADFARDKNDPSFEQLTLELEQRGEEWVDPGSRQLVWSALKNRLVLVDYPAIMRSGDIPPEWREGGDGQVTSRGGNSNAYSEHNSANEAHYDDSEPEQPYQNVSDFSLEEKRYNFVRRTGSPLTAMQNDIAQQIFDGDKDKDIAMLVEFMFKDTLASLKMSAKDAIKSTRDALKQASL